VEVNMKKNTINGLLKMEIGSIGKKKEIEYFTMK